MNLIKFVACLIVAASLTAQAEDKKLDLSGTWKSSFTNQTGQVRETIFTFKQEGEKFTGTTTGRNREQALEEVKVNGDEISFQVTREFNGNKVVTKYTGKVSGDTITGKTEFSRSGETRSREWTAKRDTTTKEKSENPTDRHGSL